MSRALRLVVTQSKCERLEIPNILQSYPKIHGVCAVVVFTKKSCGYAKMSMQNVLWTCRKLIELAEANSSFGLNADAKNRLEQNALQV